MANKQIARLDYFLWSEELQITYQGGGKKSIRAVSGGGRGQRHKKVSYPYGKSYESLIDGRDWTTKAYEEGKLNPAIVDGRVPGKNRGGPIPPGFYVTDKPSKHASYGPLNPNSVKLVPTLASAALSLEMFEKYGEFRGGFYIHGRGPKGSDGCIVPINDGDLVPLLAGIREDTILRVHDDAMKAKEIVDSLYTA